MNCACTVMLYFQVYVEIMRFYSPSIALSNTDIVIVGFQQASYTLSEDAGNITVVASISTAVAHSFTVQVTGGRYCAWSLANYLNKARPHRCSTNPNWSVRNL